jgi:1,4-alpha-glucan branching enzyme
MVTLVPVVFRFPVRLAPAARSVSVIGSFNRWNADAHRLRRMKDEQWEISIYLPPGRMVYLFCVDGVMWVDPEDEERLPNGWGSEYSVRRVAEGHVLPPHQRRRVGEQAVAVAGTPAGARRD